MKKTMGRFLIIWTMVFYFAIHVSTLGAAEPPSGEQTGTGNHYVLIFQLTDYNSQLADAVEYFFKEVFKPGDTLMVFSPRQPYTFSPKTLQSMSTDQLIKLTTDKLKKDIPLEAVNYNTTIDEMGRLVTGTAGSGDAKTTLTQYKQVLQSFRQVRNKLSENIFLQLADLFKKQNGNKYLFLFYQKEMRIIPDRKIMDAFRQIPDLAFIANEVFYGENTEKLMDAAKISQAFNNAGVKFHFLYLQKEIPRRTGTEVNELSGDIYSLFSQVAKDTGGTVVTTSKPKEGFLKLK
ncbi:MAG: hypothetical protein ACM3SY_15525 [Candidatus Omnitrophota bacterium]